MKSRCGKNFFFSNYFQDFTIKVINWLIISDEIDVIIFFLLKLSSFLEQISPVMVKTFFFKLFPRFYDSKS